MVAVLIVDDDALVRAGLGMILGGGASPFRIIGEAADGVEAIARADELHPDLILMDIRMPTMDGIEATRRIVSSPTAPKIVVLTTFDADELVLAALRAGADGFLLKDTPPAQMEQALTQVMAGHSAVSPRVLGAVVAAAREQGENEREARARAALAELTARERDVAVEVGRGLSNAEIAEVLYQSVATVKATLTRVLVKLGCTNRTQVAIIVHDARVLDPR